MKGKKMPQHANFGNDNPSWKGGISTLSHRIRTSEKYEEWRIAIFKRDNFRCQSCGKRGGYLEVHHKIAFKEIISRIRTFEEALSCQTIWDVNNGMTVCRPCHSKITFKQLTL